MSDPLRASMSLPDPYAPPRVPPSPPAPPAAPLGDIALIYGLGGGLLSAPYCLARSTSLWGFTSGFIMPGFWFWLLALLLSVSVPVAVFHLQRPASLWGRFGAGALSTSLAAGLAVGLDATLAHPLRDTAQQVAFLSGLAALGILPFSLLPWGALELVLWRWTDPAPAPR